jgi:hypothetical protein
MAEVPPARSGQQRKQDTLRRLAEDADAWVATASADGVPTLVPLSFLWTGDAIMVCTPREYPTGRNLAAGRVRLGLGDLRDVVLVQGRVTEYTRETVPAEWVEAFAAKHGGWDPRESDPPFGFFAVEPRRIQAWREENELADRDLMRAGAWVV